MLSRCGGQYRALGPLDSFVAEVEVSVVEQVVQVWVDVVGDTTLVVDDQVVTDEDDVAPTDPTRRKQRPSSGETRSREYSRLGPFRLGGRVVTRGRVVVSTGVGAASAFEFAVGDDQELSDDPERDQLPAAHAHRVASTDCGGVASR